MSPLAPMWDAVDWAAIPAGARAVAGYLDGPRSAWSAAGWNRWTLTPHLVISVLGDTRANTQDTEATDQTPTRAVGTGVARLAAGLWTVVYCNRSTLPEVLGAARVAKVAFSDASQWPRPGLYLWVADPGTPPHLDIPGCPVTPVAVQHQWTPGYDLSACYGTFPVLPAPARVAPIPRPVPFVGVAADIANGGYWLVQSDGGVFTHGKAQFHGSMGGHPLAAPVVAIAATPTGRGYWLLGGDGGVFAFGDAPFEGAGR